MELSRTIALMAVVLGMVLAAGYALGEDNQAPAPKQMTVQKKVDDREAQRRSALAAHEKRKAHFERSCNKPLKSDTDFVLCRAAYRELVATPE
jgi:hypothetical protein